MRKYNRDKRHHNEIYKEIPDKTVYRHFFIYTKRDFFKGIKTYNTTDSRETGILYYHLPEHGYVKLDDLYDLKCSDYRSKFGLTCWLDSLIHPKKKQEITIEWRIS